MGRTEGTHSAASDKRDTQTNLKAGATVTGNKPPLDINPSKKPVSSLSDSENPNKEKKNLSEAQQLIKKNETNLKAGKLGEVPSKPADKGTA